MWRREQECLQLPLPKYTDRRRVKDMKVDRTEQEWTEEIRRKKRLNKGRIFNKHKTTFTG